MKFRKLGVLEMDEARNSRGSGVSGTWKKEVCEGSRPVFPAGTVTSLGATRPTRAGAPTLNLAISSLTCIIPHLVSAVSLANHALN